LFRLPVSDRDLFHLVEEKVYRVIGGMLAAGFPITEFIGGRKNKDSLYTKLLSKRDATSAQIYDKLRFRIVTRSYDDIFPVIQYLTTRIVHRWEWFDPATGKWVPESNVTFSINGGRDQGYRGYTIKSKPKPGAWRVNIVTDDGRPLGRIRFAVLMEAPPKPLVPVTLN
jgi:hypothetical protein